MIFINQFKNDKENINININTHYASINYSNLYFIKSQSIKFKTCRKYKKDFFLRNKLHAYFKTYKDKIKDINKIVFNLAMTLLKNVNFNFNDNLENVFIIIITNFAIIFINNDEIIIDEQKKIEKTTYFVNLDYFIIESMSKKISNIELIFKK